jgi:hypothetical protein
MRSFLPGWYMSFPFAAIIPINNLKKAQNDVSLLCLFGSLLCLFEVGAESLFETDL